MLQLKNLSKRFADKIVFEKFSYTFSDAGVYIIEGASGIGKTTLLRMIAGLDNDYEGSITGGGADNVSVAFQEHRLFPELSLWDNVLITLSSEQDIPRARSLLEQLGFTSEELLLKPSQLSGGMKQRVSLTRALMKQSPVLLLDEPTKELDAMLVEKLLALISKEGETRTVIVVSHDDMSSIDAAVHIRL